jgi:hypothetical protein
VLRWRALAGHNFTNCLQTPPHRRARVGAMKEPRPQDKLQQIYAIWDGRWRYDHFRRAVPATFAVTTAEPTALSCITMLAAIEATEDGASY